MKRFLDYLPLIGNMFDYISLWKDFSLAINIVQNALIIVENNRFWNPELKIFGFSSDSFSFDEEAFKLALGASQVALASIIFVEYITRKFPARYRSIYEKIKVFVLFIIYSG